MLLALASLCACDSSLSKREHVVKQLDKLAAGKPEAEAKLAEAPPHVVQDPLALFVLDPKAPAAARAAAIRVLRDNITHELFIPTQVVEAFLTDPSLEVRTEALEALVRSGDPEHINALQRAAVPSDPLHEKVAAAMPRYEESRRRWYKEEMVLARTSAAQMIAVRALGDVGTREDIPALKLGLENGPPQVKFEALLTLAKLGGPEAADLCLARLEDEDPFIRAAAISAIQTLKDARAIPSLQKALLEDGVADNRVSAAAALAAIGGKDARLALSTGCASPATNPIRQACKSALKRIQ